MAPYLLDVAAKGFLLLLLAVVAAVCLRRSSAAKRHFLWASALGFVLSVSGLSLLLPSVFILPDSMTLAGFNPVDSVAERSGDAQQSTAAHPKRLMQSKNSVTPSPIQNANANADVSISDPPNTFVDATQSSVIGRLEDSVMPSPRHLRSSPILYVLMLIWGAGVGLMLVLIAFGAIAGRRLLRACPEVTCGKQFEAMKATSLEMRVVPPVLHVSHAGTMPMVWGLVNCHLLLPEDAVAWDSDRLRSVLLHELAHLRRRDQLTMLIGQITRAVHWFNPLAWLAVSRLRIEREQACDDDVLRRGVRASDYAACLLEITTRRCSLPATAISLAMADARRIEGRVRTILDADQNRCAVSKRSAAVTLMIATLVTVSLSMVRAGDEKPEPAPSEALNSETTSVATTLVTPTSATLPEQKSDASPAEVTDAEKEAKAEALLARLNEVSKTKISEKVSDLKPDELAGLVVDADFNPLSGVLVDIWTFQPGTETTTDENGLFRLKIGDAGTRKVEVRCSKPGYSPDYRVQQTPGEVMFVGLDNKTFIEGTLRGADGMPIAQAVIKGVQGEQDAEEFVFPGPTTLATTDANGRYRMYVFRDTYDIQVSVSGVGVARVKDVLVNHEEAKSLDINLQPAVRFEAKVVDAISREPVEKFVLWNCFDTSVLGISDAGGNIVIDGLLPGEYEFFCGQGEPLDECGGTLCYGHGNLGRWWSVDAAHEHQRAEIGKNGWQRNFDNLAFNLSVGMKPVTIETERGVTFSGHVYDPDDNPVEGATVAPAQTGTGNSLTGDTRYSTKTANDGSYRVVMPAGNKFQYNLMAHDGDYQEWRNWANVVTATMQTEPGQQIENFDLTLNRPATVRGRLVIDEGLSVGDREVTAESADLRENRYYNPTTKVNEDGTFELRFLRPGKQIIHLGHMRPSQSSVDVELKEGEVLEGIELRAVSDFDAVPEQMKKRTFRITVLNGEGQPAANQQLWLSTQHRMSLNLEAFAGDRAGFANRMKPFEKYADTSRRTDAGGHVDISGGSQLFGDYNTSATVIAVNSENAEGAIGHIRADLKSPEITLHMAPLCEVRMAISTDELPASDEHSKIELLSSSRLVVDQNNVGDQFVSQLPVGEYGMTVSHPLAIPQEVKFTVMPGSEQLTLEPVRLMPSHLARLFGQPAPELQNIEAWLFGDAVRIADQRGKIVILAFWHRSYHGWENSVPTLTKLRESYSENEVVIIGVFNNFWLRQLHKTELWDGKDLPFRVALADSSSTELDGDKERIIQGRAMSDYGVTSFPKTLLIDREGRVVSLLKPDDFDNAKTQIDGLPGGSPAVDTISTSPEVKKTLTAGK